MRGVVHLELHTPDLPAARSLYGELLGWRSADVGGYMTLDAGGGIVQCGTPRSVWLPYLEVDDVGAMTGRAQRLGARVLLAPREGPTGWRSVVATRAGGEIAFWRGKS